MGFFDWVRGKQAPAPEPEQKPPVRQPMGQFSTDPIMFPLDRESIFDQAMPMPTFQGIGSDGKATAHAMDAYCGDEGNNPYATKNAFITATQRMPDSLMNWYANQGFIGYQACAIFAQNWLVMKACAMPAEDAARNGWKATVNDGSEESVGFQAELDKLDKKFKVKQNLVEFTTMKRVFGVRIALFVVESDDPDYYLKPYNPDGIKPGSYKGISQVDPYWMTPYMGAESIENPAGINFYEPTWWQIGGKRYHRSHLIIARHAQVADIIKPAYMYGGVPLTQQIFERIYAAERTANEAPLLAMTKRMNVVKVDLDKVFADPVRFKMRMAEQVEMRDNYGTRVINTDEDYVQHETSLADLDATIMTQYQLVSAIAGVPATKLLGTSPKGFGASGDYEIASYHELLAGTQENDFAPILARHYEILDRSEFGGSKHIEAVFNPLDEPKEKDVAEINKIKADTYTALQSTGAIDGQDIRDAIVKDEQSGFSGIDPSAPEPLEIEENDAEADAPPAATEA